MTPVRVVAVDDVERGTLRACRAGGVPICLARVGDGTFYAVEDACSHERTPLSDGDLVDHAVECPLHGARFDLRTGEPIELPATERIRRFDVTVADGSVFIDVQDVGRPTVNNG